MITARQFEEAIKQMIEEGKLSNSISMMEYEQGTCLAGDDSEWYWWDKAGRGYRVDDEQGEIAVDLNEGGEPRLVEVYHVTAEPKLNIKL